VGVNVNNRKLLKYLRTASLIWLLLLGGFWFGFALLSGAERYGGGIDGVIQNSPNALPWLLLLIVAAMSFRWPWPEPSAPRCLDCTA
jgi:hypothetical protein